MSTHSDESSQTSYNGTAESPVTTAESADGVFKGDGYDSCSVQSEGRGHKGLTVAFTTMFLLAEMAGAGILNLPKAVVNTGWTGLPMMMALAVAVGFAGTRLGLCWIVLEERWPEYRAPCRRPYPAIAHRALGKPGQILAEFSLGFTLFGAATVYLLLASQMVNDLLHSALPSMSQCAWNLILGVVLCPTTWFSSPKDFWGAPLMAMCATTLACLVVVVEVVVQKNDHDPPEYSAPTFNSFFLGFGSILFALGGASIFPTIQNDMKDRTQFPSCVIITFLVLLAIYLPVCTICYGVLGSNGVPDNILDAVTGPAVTVTQAFILCHFLFAVSIVINPVNQAFEGLLKIPSDKFGVKRVVLRSCVFATVMLVGFAIPDFGKILDLVGGSTIALMSFVLPPLCYLRLCSSKGLDGQPHRMLAKLEVAALWVVILIGVTGGVASTYSALSAIITQQSFNSTCFSPESFRT